MSKIFRLYTGGTNTYQDWNNSPTFPYDSKSRDTIKDPEGASAKNEITSIPSPFARIDLVKNAFKEVCKPDGKGKVDLDGTTIFHKMVSDTLDVAEIFFNIDRFQDKVEIIKWDKSQMLGVLQESIKVGHKCLGDVLDKYLQADGATYNFSQLQAIYLLNYIGNDSKDELDIIGATSPATLFFSNANDLSYIKDISFGLDKPFDSDYQPLYKRDFELVKYLFALRSSIGNFASLFPEVNSYLDETLKAISDQTKKKTLRDITGAVFSSLSPISVKNEQQANTVEVLGNTLYCKDTTGQPAQSDFIIKSSTNTTKLQPLVLPTMAGNTYADLQYITDKWGTKNAAPYQDDQTDLPMRRLPDVGNQYPYLTISDFLEDNIICVPYIMNSQSYFDGNSNIRNNKDKKSYLLPIKPLFFNYFTIEELKGSMPDGKLMLEMSNLAGGGVKVTLRIPIKGKGNISYVEYERKYHTHNNADIKKNSGGVKELKFTGFIMPQVKFKKVEDAIYNVSCVQKKSGKVAFSFLKRGEKVGPAEGVCRDRTGKHQLKAENYFLEKRDFDCIQVTDKVDQGMMIPIFKEQENIDSFEFAVDLGTSNTHIEYKESKQKNSSEFSFTAGDKQLCEMFTPTFDGNNQNDLIEETELIIKDFIPAVIGEGDFRFPTRTVLSHSASTDWNDNIEPYTLVNLPFTYGKRMELPYNKFRSDIKWGEKDELKVMEAYIRCLMLIMRNKVLLNNGDLSKTKVTWFYPISMPKKRVNSMKDKWDSAYKKYFGNGDTLSMTESVAPMSYLFDKHNTASDLVNVDIGGGTTDIAFARENLEKKKEVQYVTSFRFAANTLFEDSFAPINNNNGIIDYHKGEILKVLEEKQLNELVSVFNSSDNENPANMASFLFSLKNNSFIKKKQINVSSIDFNHILREDENFKVVFILFYTAIIYHIAQMVKELSLEVPRHISFSGNGSKVIRVITTNSEDLANYTKLIFEKIIGKKYGKKLELLGLDGKSNPKESTSKGGIIGNADAGCDSPKVVVFKSDCSGVVNKETYDSVDRAYRERTVKATKDFFKFALEEMPNAFDLRKQFGVTRKSLQIALKTAKEDLGTFLDKGIYQRLVEVDKDEVIDETFFFYPIKGVLQAISGEIYKSLQNDENN